MPDAKTKTKSNSHEDDLFKIEYPEDSFAIQRDMLQVRLTGAIEAVFDADDRIETFPVKKHSRWKPKDLERFVDLAYDLGAYEWEPEARKPFIKALADLRRRLGPAPKALPEVDRLIDMAEIFEDDDLLSAALDPSNEIWRRGDEEAFLRCMRVFRAVLHQLIRYEITGPKLKPIRPDHRALPTKALAAIGRSRAGWTNLRGHLQHWIPRRDRDVLVTQGLPVFLDKFSEQMGIKPLRFPFEVALPVKSGLLALSKDSPTPVSALLTTLFFESVVCAGASTDLGDPFAVFTELWPQDWLFTHILFMPVDAYPELEAECEAQRLGRETLGDNFRIIVPIPLYKEEAAWILDHGRRAFFESPNRPSPVFDPDRPNPLANYLKTSSPLRLADEKPLLPERLAALRVGVQRKVIEENAPVRGPRHAARALRPSPLCAPRRDQLPRSGRSRRTRPDHAQPAREPPAGAHPATQIRRHPQARLRTRSGRGLSPAHRRDPPLARALGRGLGPSRAARPRRGRRDGRALCRRLRRGGRAPRHDLLPGLRPLRRRTSGVALPGRLRHDRTRPTRQHQGVLSHEKTQKKTLNEHDRRARSNLRDRPTTPFNL